MKYADPKQLSFSISFIITGFSAIFYFSFFWHEINWVFIGLSSLLLFILSYLLFKYAIEHFIYEKIKLIYKTIRISKTSKDAEKNNILLNIDLVKQEVAQWADDKKDEIEQLKKLEIYRREFLGNVSHELKTPIFNIQGYVLTLLDGGLEDQTINKEYLLRTEKSIERMITIVEDLENISKLESGSDKLNMVRFNITTFTKEVFEFLEMNAHKNNIRLQFDKNYEKPIFVLADKQKINQVMINLLDNSIKYGNKNGFTKVSFFDMDDTILIEITDDGIGIEEAEISRLFERFYRIDKSRSREQGGSGLGLAIVKHILEAHKQTINVRSTVGIGTTFAFTLKKG